MYINIEHLKAIMRYHNISQERVAKALGISRDTFIRRMKRQEFTIKQVHRMMEAIPLSMEEMEQIFFVEADWAR